MSSKSRKEVFLITIKNNIRGKNLYYITQNRRPKQRPKYEEKNMPKLK